MKNLILLLGVLYSINSLANTVCTAHYAAGIGHVFSGESRILGDKETVKESESTGDELYTMTVENQSPILQETRSKKQIPLIG